jgi:dTDP-4-dehydrorhamnose 3,5-epimerase
VPAVTSAAVPLISRSEQIAGVLVVEPESHADARGRFVETYRREWFPDGLEMVQSNRSEKSAGTLTGLHYHRRQTDYWYLLRGAARVGLCDLRRGSPTEGAILVVELVADEERGLLVPPGVAHGFAAVTDVLLTYLVDHYYDPADELGVAWDDPDIGIDWGITEPVLSDRDAQLPRRHAIEDALLPIMGALGPS